MAMCAGLAALKDSHIPLVKAQITTTTGKILAGDWALPESLQQETGIIFASVFPGYNNFVEEVTAGLAQKFQSHSYSQILNFYTQLLDSISNSKLKSELEDWFAANKSDLTVNQSQKDVDGTVYVRLYKGNVIILKRSSEKSFYSSSTVSMDIHGDFDQQDAAGFIKILSLRLKREKK